MAVTAINITQSNQVGGCIAMTINNPLTIIAEATYNGVAPDYLTCNIYAVNNGELLLGQYKMYTDEDTSSTTRSYYIEISEILKSYLLENTDYAQTVGTFMYDQKIQKHFRCKISNEAVIAETDILAINGVRQFKESPCLSDLADNSDDNNIVAYEDEDVYIYFYNNSESNLISLTTEPLTLLPPTITPNGGSYKYPKTFTMTSNNSGDTKYYRINGGAWVAYTTAVTVPIGIAIVNGYATKSGYTDSSITTAYFETYTTTFDENPVTASMNNYIAGKVQCTSLITGGELIISVSNLGIVYFKINPTYPNYQVSTLTTGAVYQLKFTGVYRNDKSVTFSVTMIGDTTETIIAPMAITETPQDIVVNITAVANLQEFRVFHSLSDVGGKIYFQGIEFNEV